MKQIDLKTLSLAARKVRAINHPMRRRIMELLDENGSMTVTEIYVALRIEQSVASQHLAPLRRCGFVVSQRVGQTVVYRIDYAHMFKVERLISELAEGVITRKPVSKKYGGI